MKKLVFLFLWLPKILFAQEIVEEEVLLTNGEIVLPGTLSFPKTNTKVPLALFIHGSGNGDRNGNQEPLLKTDHIKLLADSLNAKGIGFYRYDKRTASKENLSKIEGVSLRDFVADAKLALQHFYKDKRFSGIHVIGHSQGSLIGMLTVGNEGSSYISLAGPGTTIDKAMIRQITAQNQDLGKAMALHVQELLATDTIQEVNPFLMPIFKPQNQSFFKEWISLDPAVEIKKLRVPVLIINGDTDLQVRVEDAQLLKDAKPEAQLAIIPKMNHTLKKVNTLEENQRSYREPDFPLSKLLVQTIHEFIKQNE